MSLYNNKLSKIPLGMLDTDVQTKFTGYDTSLAQKMSKADIAININDFPKQGNETDDTARLQRAINQCVTGSTLLIPFTTTLTVSSNILVPVAIKVKGGGTINFTSVDTGVATTGNEIETALFDFNTQITDTSQIMYGISFEDITFIGTVTDNNRADCQTMIRTWFCNDLTIKNCTFKNTNIAVRPRNSKYISFTNNRVKYLYETKNDRINGYGLMLETTDTVTIAYNLFYCVERHCIYLNTFKNTVIQGNQFLGDGTYIARTGYELPIKVCDGQDLTITGNVFRYMVGGVHLAPAFSAGVGAENVVIEGNTFDTYQRNDSIVTGFIWLNNDYLKAIQIKNNTFKNAYNHHLVYSNNGHARIEGNIFDTGTQGIRIDTTNTSARLSINHNTFKNLSEGVTCTNANALVHGKDNGYDTVTSVASFSANPNGLIYLDSYDINNPDFKLVNNNAATIDVSLGNAFKVSNTAGTNVTGFTGGSKQQKVTLWFTNSNTILNSSASFYLKGGTNITSSDKLIVTMIQGTLGNWFQV